METLQERIEKRESETAALNKVDIVTYDLLNAIPFDFTDTKVTLSTYKDSCHMYFYFPFERVEDIELTIIPFLSERTNEKWRKQVSETIMYSFSTLYLGIEIYFTFYLSPPGTCTVKKVLTGRTTSIHKTISVEVPEYETILTCSEMEE